MMDKRNIATDRMLKDDVPQYGQQLLLLVFLKSACEKEIKKKEEQMHSIIERAKKEGYSKADLKVKICITPADEIDLIKRVRKATGLFEEGTTTDDYE